MAKYYLDSCIWLNFFKKEGDSSKGKAYWKIAKDFIENIKNNNNKIIVSTIVLKELSFKEEFNVIKKFFKDEEYIEIIKTNSEDYKFARKLENETNFQISFYDYLHIAISKRLEIPLITRDKELIEIAKNILPVNKPEDLIC